MLKRSKGITLVALIITIIVLLILVGVTLSITLGENGIFSQSKLAVQKYENAKLKEEQELQDVSNLISNLGVASNRDNDTSNAQLLAEIESLKSRITTLEASNQGLQGLPSQVATLSETVDTIKNNTIRLEETVLYNGTAINSTNTTGIQLAGDVDEYKYICIYYNLFNEANKIEVINPSVDKHFIIRMVSSAGDGKGVDYRGYFNDDKLYITNVTDSWSSTLPTSITKIIGVK